MCFCFNDTANPEIYTYGHPLSLHDARPIFVGGGPAGAAAAVYAARKGIRTGIVAERFGGQVLDTMAIENFISVKETEGPKFAAALEQHVKDYDVDIMNLQKAQSLVPGKGLTEVRLADGGDVKGKTPQSARRTERQST